jgi:hypothetical protein
MCGPSGRRLSQPRPRLSPGRGERERRASGPGHFDERAAAAACALATIFLAAGLNGKNAQ